MKIAVNEFRADLHCHTTCSDGTATPREIVELACLLGLRGLSITDHDTVEAYPEALPIAKEKGLALLSGVEFSASHEQQSVHLLAYSFPLESPFIRSLCERHKQRRRKRNSLILERLASQGMPLAPEDFPPSFFEKHPDRPFGRPHIALAMLHKGYVQSIQQAFHDYIGEGKPCYATGETISVEETLEIIHQARGLAVIAHPHLIENPSLLRDLLEMNFDGIEGYYGRFAAPQQERWVKMGLHRGWLITGGSDFHGEIKPNIPLGSSWVNEETFQVLYQHFQRNQNISDSRRPFFPS